MHWFAAVVVPSGTTREDAEKLVDEAMAPHREADGDVGFEGGWWDWWQVGGRWTGVWGEYDPHQDPANVETCIHCGGSGRRVDAARFGQAWIEATGGCNGCKGEGTCLKWPSQWATYDGDVIKVSALLNNPLRRPMTLVLPDGRAVHREWWTGKTWTEVTEEEWEEQFRHELEPYRNEALVVVDYHS